MSLGVYIMSHRGSIMSYELWRLHEEPPGLHYEPLGPPSRLVQFRKKVLSFICVLPTKVARDGPGLTRERRDDDYSP